MSMQLLLNQHIPTPQRSDNLRQTTNDRGVCEQTTVPGCAQTTLAVLANLPNDSFGGLERHLCHTLELGLLTVVEVTPHIFWDDTSQNLG